MINIRKTFITDNF